MNHRQRIDACREVVDRLLDRYGDDIVAVGVFGSVARWEDEEHSDIDMKVLATEKLPMKSHAFVLKNCLFSIEVRTEDSWRRELIEPNSHLCLSVGSLDNVIPAHDPTGVFSRLRTMAKALPVECWRNAVRDSMEAIVEDVGRVRNAYERGDTRAFRAFSATVPESIALVQANLSRRALATERELYSIFETVGGYDSEPARAFRVAVRAADGSDDDVMDAIEFLSDYLVREAMKQSSMLQIYGAASSYSPP